MRLKSLSGNDFLYVSLAFRQASVVAVSPGLTAGEATRPVGLRCPSNGDELRLLELGLSSNDEDGSGISGEQRFFLVLEARVDPEDLWHL